MKKFAALLFLIVILFISSLERTYANKTEDFDNINSEQIQQSPKIQDRRKYDRFYNKNLITPIKIKSQDKRIEELIDLSRGGVAIKHNNSLSLGEIIPINISYGEMNIPTEIEIVSTTKSRAGAKYTFSDFEHNKQLLYLTILLEYDNHLLKTKLSG